MPRVVISGYYGFHNSGDEAMLHAMLEALGDAVPGLEPVVLSKDPVNTAGKFGVAAISRDNPWLVWRALRRSDLLISGGGGLLQDVTGPKSIIYYLGVIVMARLLGKPVFVYAQGIGPVRSAAGRALVRLVLKRVSAITVRDPDSRDELLAMGVTRPPVLVTADPVLGLDTTRVDAARGRRILAGLGLEAGGAPVAGISVRPWKKLDGFKEAVARAADDLAAAGWRVLLVPMHHPLDLEACRDVAARMRGRAQVLEDRLDHQDLLALTANLDLALGMRLHFLVFSVMFGVPVVGITYDPKVNRFLQSAGLPAGLDVETLDHGRLSSAISEVLASRERENAGLKDRAAGLRRLALKNAGLLAELLRRDRRQT